MRSRHHVLLVLALSTVPMALGAGWGPGREGGVSGVVDAGRAEAVSFREPGRVAVRRDETEEELAGNVFRAGGLVELPGEFNFERLEYLRVFVLDASTGEPLVEPEPVLEDGTWGPVELEVPEGQEIVFRTWRGGVAPTQVVATAPGRGEPLSIVLTPPMGHDVWFYVTDGEGEVIEGATVEVRFPEAGVELAAIVQENRYHFLPGAPAGIGIARASAEGYEPQDGYVVRLPFLEPYTTWITLSKAVECVEEGRSRGEPVKDLEAVRGKPGSRGESPGD